MKALYSFVALFLLQTAAGAATVGYAPLNVDVGELKALTSLLNAPEPPTCPVLLPVSSAYYVAMTGSDSANGSSATPFLTLQKAITTAETSTTKTIYVEAGTYAPSATISMTAADNGISILAAPGTKPVINAANTLSPVIQMVSTSYVTIQGITFENVPASSGAVNMNLGSHNSFIGNWFTSDDRGIVGSTSSYNIITGNEFDSSNIYAVQLVTGSDDNTIDSNLINGTSLQGSGDTGTGDAGIEIVGGNFDKVTHNLIENTGGAAIALEDYNATALNIVSVGDVIAFNKIVNANSGATASDTGAIYLDGRSGSYTGITINNNSIQSAPCTGSGQTGALCVGIYLDDFTSGVTAINNVAVGGNLQVLIHSGDYNTVANNVFDMTTETAANYGAALFQGEASGALPTMTGDVFTKNIIYSTATTAPNIYLFYNSAPVNAAAIVFGNDYWNTNGKGVTQTADLTPAAVNPLFNNEAGGDYTQGLGTPAFGAVGFLPINLTGVGPSPCSAHWY